MRKEAKADSLPLICVGSSWGWFFFFFCCCSVKLLPNAIKKLRQGGEFEKKFFLGGKLAQTSFHLMSRKIYQRYYVTHYVWSGLHFVFSRSSILRLVSCQNYSSNSTVPGNADKGEPKTYSWSFKNHISCITLLPFTSDFWPNCISYPSMKDVNK